MKWSIMQSNGRVRRGYVRDWRDFQQAMMMLGGDRAAELDTPPGLLTREWGHRAANVESEVLVPLTLSVVGGFAAGVLAACTCCLAQFDSEAAGVLTLGSGSAVFVMAFYNIARRQLDSLWTREEYGEDLPAPPPATAAPDKQIRLEIANADSAGNLRGLRFADLPIDEKRFTKLCLHITNGGVVNRAKLTEIGICSQPDYPAFRSALLAAGIVAEVDGRGGVQVTRRGQSVATQFLADANQPNQTKLIVL